MSFLTIQKWLSLLPLPSTSLNPSILQQPFVGAQVDDRELKEGQVFFALSGNKVDGHLFVERALAKGALFAVVRKGFSLPGKDDYLLPVDDTLLTLQKLANKTLLFRGGFVVAISGSMGKTTVTQATAQLLKAKYRVATTYKSYNGQIGLSLSILNTPEEKPEVWVLEMGMSMPGEIAKLIEIAPPTIALLTTISHAHIAQFGSLEKIALEKANLFLHAATKTAFIGLPIHHEALVRSVGKAQKKSFSLQLDTDYSLSDFPFLNDGKKAPHVQYNLIAAASLARECGLSNEEIEKQILHLQWPEKRLERVEKGGFLFINDAYNGIPEAVDAAIKMVSSEFREAKKIAILGDMLELGEKEEFFHRAIGGLVAKHAQVFIGVGHRMKNAYEEAIKAGCEAYWYEKREEASLKLKEIGNPGDVVLLKGSKLFEMWKVVEEIG